MTAVSQIVGIKIGMKEPVIACPTGDPLSTATAEGGVAWEFTVIP